MTYEAYKRPAPALFKRGSSALTRLIFFSALSLFLMVADAKFGITNPIRTGIATALYPFQWLALQPVLLTKSAIEVLSEIKTEKKTQEEVEKRLIQQAQRAGQAELLLLENAKLRALLELKEKTSINSQIAEVLYDTADPYSRRIVINKGSSSGIKTGSPVMDESGLLGQITRVYPLVSEITLLVDKDQITPIINTRTGVRGILYGEQSNKSAGQLELKYISANEDIQEGDTLTTSGVDGIYPEGIAVGQIQSVQAKSETSFAKVIVKPFASTGGVLHVMVIDPIKTFDIKALEKEEDKKTGSKK